ncbi:MAG: diguanylate cyclase [Rhodocyclales bacterium RIFCSPLOWO2_02_FULL_63_24]|nr:MAG: diguanylate cyclase [Rhodocyclales bacterium GWA2_65_19]OHC72671.1 MAG: diguanylate cyclase [Rhodocyclales bacterium RIFCSPLOWO2_02_FULL_63_24]
MAKPSQPSEVARETLRRLAMNKTPPTPDNYRAIYHEITGSKIVEPFPERSLKTLQSALPRDTQEQVRFARQFETAIASGNWDSFGSALIDLVAKPGAEPLAWSALIRELVQQLDTHHAGLTAAKKKETVEHVLSASSSPELLYSRLQSALRSWSHTPVSDGAEMVSAATSESSPAAPLAAAGHGSDSAAATGGRDQTAWRGGIGELQNLIAQLLDNTLSIVLAESPELARESTEIAAAVRAARNADELGGLTDRLKKLSYRAHYVAEDQAELKTALLHLVHLIIENISELVVDDQWLAGQISVVRELVNEPLNLRRLDDVERRMKDVIVKQSSLKKSLNEAKDRLKAMLATFVDRLADFSETTSGYHDKIEKCAERISQANDIADLSDVLDEVMHETRIVQINAARSRDELSAMRGRVNEAEREVTRLQNELAHASELVRHDALTGALNRKGMDEALESEVSRLRRQRGSLSLALLDIDNFKKLNDSLGHAVGDAALVHLSKVTHEAIRPQDTLARYGGEEFVVLLPNTPLEDAVSAMVRVQRELTRRFFLHNNDKVLITFSCGVAELRSDETPYDALKRADEAMYLAKRAGKNRVVPA